MTEEMEEALISAAMLICEEGMAPQDMFHPDYGWIMLKGEITPEGLEWYKNNRETLTK